MAVERFTVHDKSNTSTLKKICAGTGFILLIPGAMSLLSLIISIWFDEDQETVAFLITAAASVVPGGLLIFFQAIIYPNLKILIIPFYVLAFLIQNKKNS